MEASSSASGSAATSGALTIANLTVRDLYGHSITANAGPTAPRFYNIHLINGGEQLLKTNPAGDGSGINDGVIEQYRVRVFAEQQELATRTRFRCWRDPAGSFATI